MVRVDFVEVAAADSFRAGTVAPDPGTLPGETGPVGDPHLPQTPPAEMPPEIEEPQPNEAPAPMREPPVMPAPSA